MYLYLSFYENRIHIYYFIIYLQKIFIYEKIENNIYAINEKNLIIKSLDTLINILVAINYKNLKVENRKTDFSTNIFNIQHIISECELFNINDLFIINQTNIDLNYLSRDSTLIIIILIFMKQMIHNFNWPLININSNFNPFDFLSGKFNLDYGKKFQYEIKIFDNENNFTENILKKILNYAKTNDKNDKISIINNINHSLNIKIDNNFKAKNSQIINNYKKENILQNNDESSSISFTSELNNNEEEDKKDKKKANVINNKKLSYSQKNFQENFENINKEKEKEIINEININNIDNENKTENNNKFNKINQVKIIGNIYQKNNNITVKSNILNVSDGDEEKENKKLNYKINLNRNNEKNNYSSSNIKLDKNQNKYQENIEMIIKKKRKEKKMKNSKLN